MSWGLHDAVEVERRGRPAVTVITEAFRGAAEERVRVLGLPDHPVAVTDHPLASRTRSEVRAMAERVVDRVAAGLVGSGEPAR